MRTLIGLLLLIVAVAGLGWVSYKVEFDGQTLLERLSSATSATTALDDPATNGPPMEQVSDDDRKHLDRLVQERSR
ncbi:MAG: hypothetical protein RBU45_12965 [Myxococcota bacterium]|jgi:hypothetical protein|nr:hypothetical protein [Myxococcota bacterium]